MPRLHAAALFASLALLSTGSANAAPDSVAIPARDSLAISSGYIIGIGAGLSLGSVAVVTLWNDGLPKSLADIGLPAAFMPQPGDSLPLEFVIKKVPDMYNMVFPIALSAWKILPGCRYGASAAFSTITKKSISRIAATGDSTGRSISIVQGLGFHSVTLDFFYGAKIPERFFSVDGVSRTDFVIGVSASPYIALEKTADIGSTAHSDDARFSAVNDSVAAHCTEFNATGISFGWRTGISSLRPLSGSGGIETCISYAGFWSTRFKTGETSLVRAQLSPAASDPGKRVTYFSSRMEITFAFVRSLRRKNA
ncbi:MAG: hypothetical protein MUF22_10140 [Chitinispirillaceae bacterium]|jgi:hypothetical protein|nr:hypothetical protein [Chitinispirillaceae bacterium]